ncbi:toluene tolerance protein [sulfur-oxidizing endosymbiont of Gigantopelta aegis]|uniref:toluene tolerance protein n=1 Tax=sulfur-oxidizing endosymbiont of Gigantopelta aegis TaxID=2794934 RepID=UPI0018DB43E1|nr:toluene tolerance protein [sulfur-oxidizing endosymbiont of Gigantopelta aegis]
MKKLTLDEFNKLSQNALVLADDEFGKKVLELSDHTIIKLFRVKRFISQATIYSPARRFAKNAQKLIQLNIPTVTILALYNIKNIKRTAVHYQQLEGVMVREYLQQHSHCNNDEFLGQLGEFIAILHAKGIYFRSAHFGNIIYTPDKQFGLIDISDMSISPFSLGMFKRLRNLKHIFRIDEDIKFIQQSHALENTYLQHYKINNNQLNNWFKKQFFQTCSKLKLKHQ